MAEIARLSALRRLSKTISSTAFHKVGRNRITRTIDAALEFIRRYLPPIHWLAVRFLALLLYGYARAVGATAEIVTSGSYRWPDIPKGSVLAIWHGSAPSLLGAFTARRPPIPVKLMVSRDPRGDCVALFCRWLGFEIVRGDAEHGGWKALLEIADDVHGGAAALISPDGSGPSACDSGWRGLPSVPVRTPQMGRRAKSAAIRANRNCLRRTSYIPVV